MESLGVEEEEEEGIFVVPDCLPTPITENFDDRFNLSPLPVVEQPEQQQQQSIITTPELNRVTLVSQNLKKALGPNCAQQGIIMVTGEGEPVEVDRVETSRNGSEVEELQARASLNSSDEIQDEYGGQSKLETELHVIDMVYADIPLDFDATTFEVIMECLIASVQGVEALRPKWPNFRDCTPAIT